MEQTKDSEVNPEGLNVFGGKKVQFFVHAVRILLKLGIIATLWWSEVEYSLLLSAHLVISEILDQIVLRLIRVKPSLKSFGQVFYVLNSVLVISTVGFFAGWLLNDYYLIYLIHISSATIAYGYKIGLFSFSLSLVTYSTLLFFANAPLEIYIRLPLLSILALRLFITQASYQRIDVALKNVLNVEKAKQDFIAIASHNLRTPVAAIYGYIDLLLRGEAGKLSDNQTLYVKRIKSNNQELEKLTEELLQISILEIGKEINVLKQPSQIEVIIGDIVENFALVAKAKGLELTFQKEKTILPVVDIDVDKIRSVILNLVDNALKYTEKGKITIAVKKEGDFVIVSVSDTGIGISKEDLDKIFDKFYRSGNILVYNQKGVGLGLYLGKKIVELHGGTMTVNSTEGHGSTFEFTLPVMKEEVL